MADRKLNDLGTSTSFDHAYVESATNQYRITKENLGKQLTNYVHQDFQEYSNSIDYIYGLKGTTPIKISKSDLASVVAQTNEPSNYSCDSGGMYASVDLELPSGRLWAKYNVGATKETEFGSFFAWGATVPYREGIDSTDNYAASYANTIQHNLYPNQDAATVNWGRGWRMPTQADGQELIDNTYSKWGSLVDGEKTVTGRFFFKVKDATHKGKKDDAEISALYDPESDLYLFIPAAGYLDGLSHYNIGSYGIYWCSSRDSSAGGWRLYFCSSDLYMHTDYRYYGFSVRPVRA